MIISNELYQHERVIKAAKAIAYTHDLDDHDWESWLTHAYNALVAADSVPTPRDLIEQAYKLEKAND